MVAVLLPLDVGPGRVGRAARAAVARRARAPRGADRRRARRRPCLRPRRAARCADGCAVRASAHACLAATPPAAAVDPGVVAVYRGAPGHRARAAGDDDERSDRCSSTRASPSAVALVLAGSRRGRRSRPRPRVARDAGPVAVRRDGRRAARHDRRRPHVRPASPRRRHRRRHRASRRSSRPRRQRPRPVLPRRPTCPPADVPAAAPRSVALAVPASTVVLRSVDAQRHRRGRARHGIALERRVGTTWTQVSTGTVAPTGEWTMSWLRRHPGHRGPARATTTYADGSTRLLRGRLDRSSSRRSTRWSRARCCAATCRRPTATAARWRPERLRRLVVNYWDYTGVVRRGTLVVLAVRRAGRAARLHPRVRRPVPHQEDGAGRRLLRTGRQPDGLGRARDERRQHLGVQLPRRHGLALPRQPALLRQRHRHQHLREPVRDAARRSTPRRPRRRT